MNQKTDELLVIECPRKDVHPIFRAAARDGVVSVTKPQLKRNKWVGVFRKAPGVFEPVGCSLIFEVGTNQWRLAGAWVHPSYRGAGLWEKMLGLRLDLIRKECEARMGYPMVVDAFVRPSIKDAYLRRGFLVIREFAETTQVRKVFQ